MAGELLYGGVRREGEGTLLLAQVDDLPGELLGDALEQLCTAGAANVQLLATLTKKGRPGHLVIVDVPRDRITAVEQTLVAELGVTGWHCLATRHVHLAVEIVSRPLSILTAAGALQAEMQAKRVAGQTDTLTPEHRSCVALRQRLLAERGVRIPLRELVRLVGWALNTPGEPAIDLRERPTGGCQAESGP